MTNKVEVGDGPNIEFVTFLLDNQSFCVEITQIREIRRWSPVTVLPHSPRHVLGVINLRGAVIPILDLSSLLGFGSIDPSERHVIIIVQISDQICGLLVDSVSEILSVKTEMIQDAPSITQDRSSQAVQGVIAIENGMTRVINLMLLNATPNMMCA